MAHVTSRAGRPLTCDGAEGPLRGLQRARVDQRFDWTTDADGSPDAQLNVDPQLLVITNKAAKISLKIKKPPTFVTLPFVGEQFCQFYCPFSWTNQSFMFFS